MAARKGLSFFASHNRDERERSRGERDNRRRRDLRVLQQRTERRQDRNSLYEKEIRQKTDGKPTGVLRIHRFQIGNGYARRARTAY